MKTRLALIFSILLINPCTANEFDVDSADSLDFESFHKEKEPQKKTWKNPPRKETVTNNSSHSVEYKTSSSVAVVSEKPDQRNSKAYVIREHYSVAETNNTQSVNHAIESMHQQMSQLCPRGWEKLSEKSVAAEKGFYLYFELSCL